MDVWCEGVIMGGGIACKNITNNTNNTKLAIFTITANYTKKQLLEIIIE